MRQLALPFPVRHRLTDATFVHGAANEEALTWLAHPDTWPNHRLAIHGPTGCGKTHLLHAFAERHAGILLPGLALRHLTGLPDMPPTTAGAHRPAAENAGVASRAAAPIAIDDADLTPDPEALLHLLNAAAEAGIPLLLAARTPPATWRVTLPDLASRLRAITAATLGLPDDAMLEALLGSLAAQHQLRLDPHVQSYLLARLPRDAATLREAACRLDRASLASGRRVSRGIAACVLAEMGAAGSVDVSEDARQQAGLF